MTMIEWTVQAELPNLDIFNPNKIKLGTNRFRLTKFDCRYPGGAEEYAGCKRPPTIRLLLVLPAQFFNLTLTIKTALAAAQGWPSNQGLTVLTQTAA